MPERNISRRAKELVVECSLAHPDLFRLFIDNMSRVPRFEIEGKQNLEHAAEHIKKGGSTIYFSSIHTNFWDFMIDTRRIIIPHILGSRQAIPLAEIDTDYRDFPDHNHFWFSSKKFDSEGDEIIDAELKRLEEAKLIEPMGTIERTAFPRVAASAGVIRIPVYQPYIVSKMQDEEAVNGALNINFSAIRFLAKTLKRGGKLGALFGAGTRDKTGGLERPEKGIDILARLSKAPILPIAQLDTYSLQPRDAKGLDGLNLFQGGRKLRINVLELVSYNEAQSVASSYRWKGDFVTQKGWDEDEAKFSARDAIMLDVAKLDLPVRMPGIDPRGVYHPNNYERVV